MIDTLARLERLRDSVCCKERHCPLIARASRGIIILVVIDTIFTRLRAKEGVKTVGVFQAKTSSMCTGQLFGKV